jgi:Lon protease-like protein
VAAPAVPPPAAGGRISNFASGLLQKVTPGSGGKKSTDAEIGDTARITALQTVGSGMALITLDNGQQWRQQEAMAYFPLAIGDTIRIEKGALGSYRLTRVEEGWKTFMRVSRTK